jgi:hypothetical protein
MLSRYPVSRPAGSGSEMRLSDETIAWTTSSYDSISRVGL